MSNFVELLGVRDELNDENLKYLDILRSGANAFSNCHSIFSSQDFQTKNGWKKEIEKEGIIIFSTSSEKGKLYSINHELQIPLANFVLDDWEGVENIPNWNEDVEFARRLVKLTDNADIVHYGNKQILMVSGRDYVSIRMRREIDGITYTSVYSIEDSLNNIMPEVDGKVRGCLHVNGGRFQKHPTKSNITIVDTILCLDIKGMLPKGLINSQMPKQLFKECQKNQKRVANQQTSTD